MFVTLNVTQKVSKIVGLLVLVFTWYLCGVCVCTSVHTPGIWYGTTLTRTLVLG